MTDKMSIGSSSLEQVDNAVHDAGLLVLRDALGDPHEVANLLLAKPHVGVEDAVVELLLKCVRQPANLLLVQYLAPPRNPSACVCVAHWGLPKSASLQPAWVS